MPHPDQQDHGTVSQSAIPQWFKAIITIPIVIGLLWFGRDFLIPIALATLLFILTMALMDRLNSATIAGRSVPNWAAYSAALAVVFGLLIVLGYSVSIQTEAFTEAMPRYAERLATIEAQIERLIGKDMIATAKTAVANVNIKGWLSGFVASAAGTIGNMGLILMYLAFMLAERGALNEKLPRLSSSPEQAQEVRDILNSISAGVRQYMWINSITSAMSGTLAFVVLKLLGVDFATPLALSVFLLNFIPNIGSFLAVMIPTLVALLQFDTLTPALIVVVVYGGGDAIIGNIVQPRLQGKSLNLSTVVVMVALTFWGMMWGGVGAFIAVPLTVVIMIVCSRIPGLQPYARLLSSDGILPGEQSAETSTGNEMRIPEKDEIHAKEVTAATSKADNGTDMESEIAALKQELLEQRDTRRRTAETPGRPPETPQVKAPGSENK